MKSLSLIPFFLMGLLHIYSPALAQSDQSKIDSLQKLLQEEPHDSAKIDHYISLHRAFITEDTTQSMEYLQMAISLSEKIDDKERLCRAYLQLCNYSWKRGELQQAKNALNMVEQQLSFVVDAKINATFFMEQGIIHYSEGIYDEAVNSFFKAIPFYEALSDTIGVSKLYSNIGIAYWQLDALDQALEYYEKALQTGSDSEGRFLGNIGLIYRAKGDYDKALEYYLRSLEINKKNGFDRDVSINLQNIGVLHQNKEEYQLALKYFDEAHELSTSIEDKNGILYTNHAIASIHGKLGNYQEAIYRLDQSLQMAKNLHVKEEVKNIYLSLSETYEKMGEFLPALENRKFYETWKDSIANENHLNRIKELETRYETAKKNEEIAILTKTNEMQEAEAQRRATWNKVLTGGLILLAILGGLVLFILRQRFKNQQLVAAKNEEIKTARFKQQLSELEMKALRAQMNPHFIFNCMNSINRMILSEDGDNASRYLTKFSKLIRLMLENSENPIVSLEDELVMLESYIELESLRFKGKISYRISVDEDIDKEHTLIPSMVLQPFIENAIWHGLMHKDGEGFINITIKEEDDLLRCVIEDNGVGREKALELQAKTLLNHQSMGLQITEERLRLLNSRELQDLIRITDLKDKINQALGTRVDITIPIA